ncbi:MAG: hypothetical protein GXY64_04855 [Bacteroidales bacterium]|nr:hypothetical protein [Bacteroidales bacterium]
MMKLFSTISFLLLLLCACTKDKPKPIYYDAYDEPDEMEHVIDTIADFHFQSGDEVVVPYRSESGVKYVKVNVNGVEFEMIFDTGCSTTLISMAEASYLYENDLLSDDDFIGTAKSQIADGSIVEDMVVNLREVVIGGKIRCHDVQAVVSENVEAPLLLGNEVLDRIATITINNTNETLTFNMK